MPSLEINNTYKFYYQITYMYYILLVDATEKVNGG